MTPAAFEARIDRSGDCWIWRGAVTGAGRGNLRYGNRNVQAHRLAWELAHGPIPAGMLVCHHCDNGLCCRPAHLFLGTYADNTADMLAKGRGRPASKLTEPERSWLLTRIAAGMPQAHAAALLGISRQRVNQLVNAARRSA